MFIDEKCVKIDSLPLFFSSSPTVVMVGINVTIGYGWISSPNPTNELVSFKVTIRPVNFSLSLIPFVSLSLYHYLFPSRIPSLRLTIFLKPAGHFHFNHAPDSFIDNFSGHFGYTFLSVGKYYRDFDDIKAIFPC